MAKKSKKQLKKEKQKKIIFLSLGGVAMLAILATICISFSSRTISLKDLKTSYDSFTLSVSYNNDCASPEIYNVDLKSHDTFGVIDNATSDEYNCKRYFLGSKKETYQKYFAADWAKYDFSKEYPDSRIIKVLNLLKGSPYELLSTNDDSYVFGITSINDAKTVYEHINDISAFGNDWGSDNYVSLAAKVYMRKNGHIDKIIFAPTSKSTDTSWLSYATNTRLMYLPTRLIGDKGGSADYDSIRSCKEITWSFSKINETTVNYKEDLWNVTK